MYLYSILDLCYSKTVVPGVQYPSITLYLCVYRVFCSLDEVELWVVMTSMLSGALMYTVLVANAAAIITNVDQAAKAYKNKVF